MNYLRDHVLFCAGRCGFSPIAETKEEFEQLYKFFNGIYIILVRKI